jgi:hypothetical protein
VLSTQSRNRISISVASLGPVPKHVWRRIGWDDDAAGDHAIVALADTRLPRPDDNLEGNVLFVPGDSPLVVLAARDLDTCYYFTVNLANQKARQAFAAFFRWEVEIIFVTDQGESFVQVMDFTAQDCKRIRAGMQEYSEACEYQAAPWMASVEARADAIIRQYAALDPSAARSGRHCIVLLDADERSHSNTVVGLGRRAA